MKCVVTRPEPGNARTCAALATHGLEAVAAPLFVVKPLAHQLPSGIPDAILISSANAVISLDPGDAKRLADCPVFAVGLATEAAARKAGFRRITTGSSDLGSAVQRMMQTLPKGRAILRLSAPDRNDDALEPLLGSHRMTTVLTYQAEALAAMPEAVATLAATDEPVAILHFSRRAALIFADLCKATDQDPWMARCLHICISEAARLPDFLVAHVAASPTEKAMLEIAKNTAKQV